MKHSFILFIILIGLFSCNEKKTRVNTLTDFIPNNPSVVISAPSIKNLQNELKSNALIKKFSKTNTYQNLKNDFSFCTEIQSDNTILISYATVGKKLEYLFSINTKNTENNLDVSTETKNYNNVSYKQLKNKKAYTIVIDSTLVVSSSEILLENLIRNQKDNIRYSNKSFSKLHETSSDSKITAFINSEKKPSFLNSILPMRFLGKKDWTSIELNNDNGLLINGISTNTTVSHNFATNLLKTKTEESSISKIIPLNFTTYTSYNFEELTNFNSPFENFNELIDNCTEAASFYDGNNSICAFKLLSPEISENLIEQESYRNSTIYKNSYFKIPATLCKPQPEYACYLDEFLIFSNSIESLQNCISHFQNKTTLYNQYYFAENTDTLLRESHIVSNIKTSVLKNNLATALDDESIKKIQLTDFPLVMHQITYEDNYIQFNSVIKKTVKQKAKAAISQTASITLPANVSSTPQWVINHRTKEKELIVQDENNTLYLISNKGAILWKKQLEGKIQGEIKQVDLFKNRKLQLAFTTSNEFLVLDRNGKTVDQFHKKYPDGNVLALSVFDYDNNRNYRFTITQGNKITMYDNSFKLIKGFKFNKTKSDILQTPKHVKIGTKDYIIVSETNGKLHILDRQGKSRTKVSTKFSFDGNKISNHKNSLVFKDIKNVIHSVNIASGKVSKLDILQGSNHNSFNYKSALKAKLEDNNLSIKDKTIELDFGNYTAPEVIYINKKYYVNTTDLDTQKVYLYDSNANLLDKFPLYGQSAIALTNMDKDTKLEFAVKGEANSLLIYKMH